MTFISYTVAAITLISLGLYAIFTQVHFLKKIIAINIVGHGIFLLLVTLSKKAGPQNPDPVPHAMVLTGIVVAVSATAFALYLCRRIYDSSGRTSLPEDDTEEVKIR